MRRLLAVLLLALTLTPKASPAQTSLGYLSGLQPAHGGGALTDSDTMWWCDVASPPGCDSTHALTRATTPQIANYVIGRIPPGGGVTVPSANLTSGNGSVFGGVTVGSGLSLTGIFPSQTLAATGTTLTVPSASLVNGNGTALGSVALGTNLSLTGTFPNQTLNATGGGGGGISGTTSGQVAIAGASQTIASSKPLSNAAGTTVATASGTLTNGHCVSINGTGDFVDAGGACTTGGGGGTVASGTTPQVAYYAATGTTVSGNANATMLTGGGLQINRNTSSMPPAPPGGTTSLWLNWNDTDPAPGVVLDAHLNAGASNNPTLVFRTSAGTGGSPTAVQNTNVLGSLGFRGYEGTTPGYTGGVARINVSALENFTSTAQGTQMQFFTNNPLTTGLGAVQVSIGPGLSVGSPTTPGTAMTTGDLNVQGRIMQNGSPYSTGGGGVDTVTGALTAHAGGGQASATALPSQFNVITTVATSGDSVALPAGSPGIHVIVRNSGAQPLAVFPVNGGSAAINAQAANTSISVVANTSAYFEAQSATQWFTIP